MKYPIQKILSVWLTMILVTALLLMSCGTVRKTYYKDTSKTDSASITHTEEMSSGKHDSAVVKEQAGAYTKETIIEFDTSNLPYGIGIPGGGNIEQPDQVSAKNAHTEIVNNDPYKVVEFDHFKKQGRITKITIRETGTTSTKQSGTYQNNDTGSKKSDANVVVKSEKKSIDKEKETKRLPVSLIAGSVLFLLLAGGGYYLGKKYHLI